MDCKRPEQPKENTAQQKEASKHTGDWILDLFAPTFINAADLMNEKQEVIEVPALKVVSAFDPQSIKNVYERVCMVLKLDEDLRKKNTQSEKLDLAVEDGPHTSSPSESHGVDLQDPVWNSEELSVLHSVFRAAKSRICDLEARLQLTQNHNAEMAEKLMSQSKLLEAKSNKLTEATKANQRLKIHCDQLQIEAKETGMKLNAVSEMWKEIDQEKLRMMKENQELRISLNRERMFREQLGQKLQEVHQEVIREKMLAEENAKVYYENRILKLEGKLHLIEEELNAEKKLHKKHKAALDHLRNHFASLPLKDIMPSGIVDKGQVTHISHVDQNL